MNMRGASIAGRAQTPLCPSPSSLVCSRQVKERQVKSPGHWPAQPTARTAQMDFNKLLLEVGYEGSTTHP